MTGAPHLSDEQLSAHIDGALDAAEAEAVATHLDACAACTGRVDQLRATSRAVGGLALKEPPRAVDLGFLRETGEAPAGGDLRSDIRPAAPAGPSLVTRFLRARTPAWATAGLAVAAVLVLAIAVAPGLRGVGSGASTASGPAAGVGGGAASPSGASGALRQGAAPQQAAPPAGAAPGSQAQRGATNLQSVAVPNAGGLTLSLSTPSNSARRGDVVPIAARLGDASSDQSFSAYSLTVAVVASRPAAAPSGAAGGTVVGASTGADLVVRGGGSQDFVSQWVSSLGTPAPGTYTLVATLISDGHSVSVSIPITLT